MKYLVTLLFLSFSLVAISCSCWGPYNFCSVVSDTIHSDGYVIKGKKIRTIGHGMEIEILETYGKQFEVERIMVWGDLGWLCREYVSKFMDGEVYFFNLHKIGTFSFSDLEQPEDYTLSFCGRHYLRVKNNTVQGFITNSESIQITDLDYFESILRSGNCENIEFQNQNITTTIWPNPFWDEVQIVSNITISNLQVYNVTGQLVFEQDAIDSFSHTLDFSTKNLSAGVYILKLNGVMSEEKAYRIIKY